MHGLIERLASKQQCPSIYVALQQFQIIGDRANPRKGKGARKRLPEIQP
jgi:hypothetical protein